MKKFIFYILPIIIVALVLAINSFPIKTSETTANNVVDYSEKTSYKSVYTGTTDTGDVSISLRPIKIENNLLEMEISANTHSVDLSQFDLEKITTLEYNGKVTFPVSTAKLNGHHSSGTLTFKTDGKINSFTIKIKGIPKVEERIFEWDI